MGPFSLFHCERGGRIVDTREFLRNLGGVIAERRRGRKLTQEKLAEALDTSSAWVSQVERGVGNPSMDTLLKVATAFGTTPGALVETACAVEALPTEIRELVNIANRLLRAATRVLVDAARAMEREGLVSPEHTAPQAVGPVEQYSSAPTAPKN